MRILIIGATGFIGRHLAKYLEGMGNQLIAVSRNPEKATSLFGSGIGIISWDGRNADQLAGHIADGDIIINLAGENIGWKRWTNIQKSRIINSRVEVGENLSKAIISSGKKPALIVQGSATGYYGTYLPNESDESTPSGAGFLAGLTSSWEASVAGLSSKGIRVVYLRSGVVLGKGEGMLQRLSVPFRFGAGVIPGSGKQWLPWIHIDDLVRAIGFLIRKNDSSGPYNLVSPCQVILKDLIKIMAEILHRPLIVKVPSFLLTAIFGEMARETIFASQRILPDRLMKEGFRFQYDQLAPALGNLLK